MVLKLHTPTRTQGVLSRRYWTLTYSFVTPHTATAAVYSLNIDGNKLYFHSNSPTEHYPNYQIVSIRTSYLIKHYYFF